jgi:biopolymer transport protein ExbD
MKRLRQSSDDHSPVCKPQLTSLIDVMTILLVFLMKSFSVEGNLITPSDDLQLPLSASREAPVPVATLEISATSIMSDGEVILPTSTISEDDSLELQPLTKWLIPRKNSAMKEIMLQADQHIPFTIIKRVMFTCSKAGFDDFTILVQREG